MAANVVRSAVREKPILFSGEMVKAILAGRKSQTRLVIHKLSGFRSPITEFGPSDTKGYDWHFRDARRTWQDISAHRLLEACPHGSAGDILWVRESFQPLFADSVEYRDADYKTDKGYNISYVATDGVVEYYDEVKEELSCQIKPSILMPRWASRINLQIEDVRVERVQDISEEDAIAEGIEPIEPGAMHLWLNYNDNPREHAPDYFQDPRQSFRSLWDSINGQRENGKYAWRANPWTFAVSFRRIEGQANGR